MTAGLTPRQGDLLRFIRSYVAEHDGTPPTVKEMATALHVASKGSVAKILDGLEKRGLIRRIKFAMRSVSLVEPDLTIEPGTAYALDVYCEKTKADRRAVVDAAINEYLTTHQLSTREELL